MDTREQAIQSAISDLNSGVHTSQRAAARAYGIPQSTLSTRIHGTKSRRTAHADQQRLTPEQESFLVDWILEQDMHGYPPSHERAREMAIRILRMNGDLEPLGKHWLPAFIKRNPRVASVIGRKLEVPRAEASTPAQIRAFIRRFEQVRIRLGIQAEDIYGTSEPVKSSDGVN
jgi:hypothetical protein